MKAAKKPAIPKDPLDLLAADPLRAITMLLWLDRYRNPEMAVQINPADLKGFDDCTGYLKVAPKVLLRRPPGTPPHPGLPVGHPRYPQGLAPTPEGPPRDYVLVSLVDADGNAFKPIENSEEGAKLRDKANELRALRESAPRLAEAVASAAANNTFSNSDIVALCNAAIMLARA